MPKEKNQHKSAAASDEKFRDFFTTTVADIPAEMVRREEEAAEEHKGLFGRLFGHAKPKQAPQAGADLELPTGEVLLGADALAKPDGEEPLDLDLTLRTADPGTDFPQPKAEVPAAPEKPAVPDRPAPQPAPENKPEPPKAPATPAPQPETLLEKMDEPKKSVTSQIPEPQSETSESDSVAAEISEQADNAADADASVAASQKTGVAETTSTKTDAPKYPFAAEPEPVLGEVLGGDVHTLADTIAAPKDMASEIVRKERITDLKQAIGINDKFLLLRDLFGGDTERYERTIDRLNEFDDLDDCIIYISENYDWNPSSDGVRFLMELLERKLS